MTRPLQIRRHARQMRRYGLQPMVVINASDQLPDLIIVTIIRWLWRYRSELTPVYLTLTVVAAAWVLHATYPRWWPAILAATTVAALVVLTLGARLGLARASERAYAATVVMAVGGWLSAGTAYGPAHSVLVRLLLLGIPLAVPWWAHRRRRARVRVERKLAAWPDIAETIGLPGSKVMSAVVDAYGWTARLALRRGHTVTDAIGKLPAIESALGTRPGAVRIEGDPSRADRLVMRVLHTDPHAQPLPWTAPDIRTVTRPVPLGVFEDATPVSVLLLRRHALIGGVVGSGKSGVLNVILAVLAGCEDVVIWGIDLKGGMELRPWSRILDRLATTPERATTLLHDAVVELDGRAAGSGDDGTRVWEPTRANPALVIVIDEYAELPDTANTYAESIARRGRAVAVTLLAATQRPTQKAMGHGATRSQMDVRICLRVRERRDSDLILGQGMFNAGWHAHILDAPGKFLISAPEHSRPRRARAYLITDADVTATVERYASQRAVLSQGEPAPEREDTRRGGNGTQNGSQRPDEPSDEETPEGRLWRALVHAPKAGASVADLMRATGMGRSWVYYRLQELSKAGRVARTIRGRWRAVLPSDERGDA